jgi:hypothetical protein
MGRNESASEKSPRGVRGFLLDNGNNFTSWKVQGKVGGYTKYLPSSYRPTSLPDTSFSSFLDKTRGVLNEGGLFGERKGWHLPGFDTSSWETRDISSGLPNNTPGVGFFVAKFHLSIPEDVDAPISFVFGEALGQAYRAYLFVNGWMMGKRVGNLGPQAKFPVHQGILDYNGTK